MHYALSGWLGGFSSQGDNATLVVTFENSSGKAVGTTKIGPVTAAQRKDVSEHAAPQDLRRRPRVDPQRPGRS